MAIWVCKVRGGARLSDSRAFFVGVTMMVGLIVSTVTVGSLIVGSSLGCLARLRLLLRVDIYVGLRV